VITLKDYQVRVLDSLRTFFHLCSTGQPPAEAFEEVQRQNGQPYAAAYASVNVAGLTYGMPYVCLRVPTGGGKTLLACHAAGSAMVELQHAERAVILWLVPSNTILDQTADALRDERHPYRRALEQACGAVEVVTIEEALRLSRAMVEGQTVVIVATIQAFRAEDTTGRKVYGQGNFLEHLLNVPADRVGDLLPGPDGKPLPSLVNMLRLRRPIVVVDEAHNARTELSFATLGNVLPSCIIEFTATPARGSNVLHRVSAAELNAAEMVKLPLRVVTRLPGQADQLLAEAVTLRGDLEKLAAAEAQATGEYVRPIMLIQADRVDACEPLRDRLVAEFGIPAEQIKISVGSKDDLAAAGDVSLPKCPVRFILTVQKLREGWDCPFAYVLCSLKETRSATAMEQIVGRVLRLPRAGKKQHAGLNCAYVFSVSPQIGEVLQELRDALESNGFTKTEAERGVAIEQPFTPLLGLQQKTVAVVPAEIDAAATRIQVAAMGGKVRFNEEKGEITVLVPLDAAEKEKLTGCLTSPAARARVAEAVEAVREAETAFGGRSATRQPSPYEQQLDFRVPRLGVREEAGVFEFESTHLIEHPWRLSQKDASLPAAYDPRIRPAGQTGSLNVGLKGEVTAEIGDAANCDFVTTLHQQVLSLGLPGGWELEDVIAWLDRRIDHQDIPVGESAEFLRKAISGLMARLGITDVGVLVLDRFRLRDEIESKIQEHRAGERLAVFQQFLLPGSALTVSEEQTIDFRTMTYEPSETYSGGFQFKKHYFGPRPGELRERTPAGATTEEFACAQYIDSLPEVKFWVRNLARKATSFRLLTSTDWFYPDFVCQLHDGRVLAVEYKGKNAYTNVDSQEKRAVGAVWAARSGGRCRFVMPTDGNFAEIAAVARSPQ